METQTITQEVFLNAIPHEVFEAYLDEKQHSELTGAPANIDRRPGGKFTTHGGRSQVSYPASCLGAAATVLREKVYQL